jgi:type II secretory pathway component PulK
MRATACVNILSLEQLNSRMPFMLVSHRHNFRHNSVSAGSVLLAVLCLVAVLSLVIISTVSVSKQHGDMQQARQGVMRARQMAEMGVAVAAHPMVQPGDPLLRQKVSEIERFEVIRSTEESRLNLNSLLSDQGGVVLEQILRSWGFSPADAQSLVALLMDWTDADDLKRRPDSAEKLDYAMMGMPGLPLNRKLTSLDELEAMHRIGEIHAARPDWRSFFTLRGDGRLDVNTASAEVLAAATGASLENARQLVRKRQGLDELPQTSDDVPLTSLDEALALLGLAGQQAANVMPLLTLHGSTLRIESIGTAGDAFLGISVLVSSNGGAARIIEWREFTVEGAAQL